MLFYVGDNRPQRYRVHQRSQCDQNKNKAVTDHDVIKKSLVDSRNETTNDVSSDINRGQMKAHTDLYTKGKSS